MSTISPWESLLRLARLAGRPLERFLRIEAASGVVLLLATAVALVWANSPWAESYTHLWHTPLAFGLGDSAFSKPLHFWINDGLMAVFFLLVGLEIKRELLDGRLATWSQRRLPFFAARTLEDCHADEGFVTQMKGLAAYTIPKIDVQIAGTYQSLPGIVVAANYLAFDTGTLGGAVRKWCP